MPENSKNKARSTAGLAVPFGRFSRFARIGGMAANVAGGMFFDGMQQIVSGKRPSISDLLMTPANALKVTHQLANMRGAAMKIGQMLSMDSGDFLPRELSDILAQLRSEAQNMPRHQLDKVLLNEWGEGWSSRFSSFDYQPIAAASIGQVHKAVTQAGETLAIKVQYPGVKASIDSDVNNVASLLRMTGLLPAKLDIKPILEEGRRQLHEEADYIREAKYLTRFAELLSHDPAYTVPSYFPEFSTPKILAMSYIESEPIDAMMDAPQQVRDQIAHLLIELLLRELFILGVMQTDPNFANYRYSKHTKQIVLLDFGASRDIPIQLAASYRKLMQAMIAGNDGESYHSASEMGFIAADMPQHYKAAVMELLTMAMEPLQHDAPFDFGNNQIAQKMRDKGMELAQQRDLWHLPPAQTIFIQRKFSGVYMLASRLRAKVNVRALMQYYTDTAK